MHAKSTKLEGHNNNSDERGENIAAVLVHSNRDMTSLAIQCLGCVDWTRMDSGVEFGRTEAQWRRLMIKKEIFGDGGGWFMDPTISGVDKHKDKGSCQSS